MSRVRVARTWEEKCRLSRTPKDECENSKDNNSDSEEPIYYQGIGKGTISSLAERFPQHLKSSSAPYQDQNVSTQHKRKRRSFLQEGDLVIVTNPSYKGFVYRVVGRRIVNNDDKNCYELVCIRGPGDCDGNTVTVHGSVLSLASDVDLIQPPRKQK